MKDQTFYPTVAAIQIPRRASNLVAKAAITQPDVVKPSNFVFPVV